MNLECSLGMRIKINKIKLQTFGIVITLLLHQYVAALEPDFVIPLENVTIPQGRDATFTCVVNNLGGYRVSGEESSQARVAWIKADAKAILAIHDHVITNNDRLSVTHNDFNTWTLIIKGVRMEDRGQYMCQVNTDPMKMQTAFLDVVISPDILSEETSGDMMVPEGSSAKLVCKARGFPKPKITWRREDSREIIARTGPHEKTRAPTVEGEILSLPRVTRSEMGTYFCIASNGIPPSISKRIKLQVNFHPLIQVPNQLVGAPVGTSVMLICNVEASPKAINYWQRENGEMIIPNERYTMTEISSSTYALQMSLEIRELDGNDFAAFKCISKNSIGDAEGTIRLYEIETTSNPNGVSTKRKQLSDMIDDNEIKLPETFDRSGSQRQNGRLYKSFQSDMDTSSSSQSTSKLLLLTIFLLISLKTTFFRTA